MCLRTKYMDEIVLSRELKKYINNYSKEDLLELIKDVMNEKNNDDEL